MCITHGCACDCVTESGYACNVTWRPSIQQAGPYLHSTWAWMTALHTANCAGHVAAPANSNAHLSSLLLHCLVCVLLVWVQHVTLCLLWETRERREMKWNDSNAWDCSFPYLKRRAKIKWKGITELTRTGSGTWCAHKVLHWFWIWSYLFMYF